MRFVPLSLALGLLATGASAQSVESAPGAACRTHVGVAAGVGAAYALVGARLEVGWCNVALFVGSGAVGSVVDGPGAVAGVRWTPRAKRDWLVFSLHATGAINDDGAPNSVLQYGVLAGTVGAQFFPLDQLRVELAIGPAYSYMKTIGQHEPTDPIVIEERADFGLFPNAAFGPAFPDVGLSLAYVF